MTDDEALALLWRIAPVALIVGVLLGLLTANVWWMPGVGYVIIH